MKTCKECGELHEHGVTYGNGWFYCGPCEAKSESEESGDQHGPTDEELVYLFGDASIK